MLKGNSHQIDAYITFDIFNAWRPQNRFKLFALNLILGGGVGWFKNSTYYPNEYHREPDGVTITLPQRWDYHTAQQTSMSNRKYQARSIFLGGASFDFNITRSLALGVRCVYNYYTKDDIDGRERGNNNDGVFDATVMLRYKIDAEKKSHVANFRGQEALDMAVRETNPRHYVAPYDDTGAYAPDTVVATHDTVIIVRGDGESANYFTDLYYYVYFDVGEHFLYDESLKTIQQVADRLARDENLCLEIVGYCDNTGSSEFNEALGRNRALSVAEEFKAEYGISESRIYTEGRGIIRGRRSTASYSPNRRADIRVITRDMFELLHGVRPADNQAIPQPKMVEVGRGETLSKLARKYYGNVHCWVYIFEANLNKLATPNSVKPGMEIAIPVLTDQQMLIDKDEAEKRYEKYKIH
jgi:outer membrane protein OmpA-like peptidoglycan-associated protein